MSVHEALRRLAAGPTDDPEVHETLRAAGLLRLASGTGPTWVLNDRGLAELERARGGEEQGAVLRYR